MPPHYLPDQDTQPAGPGTRRHVPPLESPHLARSSGVFSLRGSCKLCLHLYFKSLFGKKEPIYLCFRNTCTGLFYWHLVEGGLLPGARPARPGARSGSMPASAAAASVTPIRRASNRASIRRASNRAMSVSPERSHAGAESFHLKPCLPDESEFMFQTEVKLKHDRSDQAWMPRRLVLTSEAVLISRTHGRDLLDSVRPSPIRCACAQTADGGRADNTHGATPSWPARPRGAIAVHRRARRGAGERGRGGAAGPEFVRRRRGSDRAARGVPGARRRRRRRWAETRASPRWARRCRPPRPSRAAARAAEAAGASPRALPRAR